MDTSFLFQNCYTGTDFENLMVQFLGEHGFRAKKTGSNDGGIDIIATSITRPIKYSFNIQCKFFNKPLSKAPIQEVYAGTHYYNNGAAPVVITNNRVTAETRIFAKKLGVEIIADAEWTEIKQVIDSKKNSQSKCAWRFNGDTAGVYHIRQWLPKDGVISNTENRLKSAIRQRAVEAGTPKCI